jgi:hypothetical protein
MAVNKSSFAVGALVGAVIGVLAVAVVAYIAWRKRHTCTRRIFEKITASDEHAVATNDSISNKNNIDDHSGAFSRATAADNPRRNSGDRKSSTMLIDLDSGLVIDSVHDIASANYDVDGGTINSIGDVKQAAPALVVQALSDDSTSTNTVVASSAPSNTVSTAVPNAATDIGSNGSAAVDKKPFWSDKVVQASKSVTHATQKAVAAHGDKAIVAYELVGAIAQHVPYIRSAYGLCNEVVVLFGAGVHIDSNCAEVVAWAEDMQVCYEYI